MYYFNKLPPVSRDQKGIEKAVLARLEGGYTVARLQIHQVHIHPVSGQANQVVLIVQTEIRHLLVHHSLKSNLESQEISYY